MSTRTSKITLACAAAILVIAAAVIMLRRPADIPAEQPTSATPTSGAGQRTPSEAAPTTRESTPVEVKATPPVVPDPLQLTEEKAVRVTPDRIFATVNGVAIRGVDLLLFGKGNSGSEQAIMPDQYEALLQRAIQRELIFQVAKKDQVALNTDQTNQLDQVRATVAARQGGDPNTVYLSMRGTLEEQTSFEVRDAEAMLLQNTLLEKQGSPPPYVTEAQVLAQYEQHKDVYGELPEDPAARDAAWQKIDLQIREELTPQLQADYQAKLTTYLDSLKAAANIQTSIPEAAAE